MNRYILLLLSAAIVIFVASAKNPSQKLSPYLQRLLNANAAASPANKMRYGKLTAEPTITTKGDTLYHVIIHTTDPSSLRNEGIIIGTVRKNFVTAQATADQIRRVVGLSSISFIREARKRKPINDVAAGLSGARSLQNGTVNNTLYTGAGVLVSDIDTGIDWKHLDFRNPTDTTKSRIVYLWDQTLTAGGGDATAKGYGVVYTNAQINAAIASGSSSVRFSDSVGHGTHVTGIIAGNGASMPSKKYAGFAPNADLLIIKTNFYDTGIIDAMDWADSIATALNEPLVVNLSLGSQLSAHDGTADDDQVVDEISTKAGRAFAISAGNDGADGIHVSGSINSLSPATITFSVPSYTPNSGSQNDYVFIDTWINSDDSVTGSISSPPTAITVTAPPDTFFSNNSNAGYMEVDNYVSSTNNKREIATYILDYSSTKNPRTGTWTLKLSNTSSNTVTYNAWFDSYLGTSGSIVTVTNADNNYTVASPGDASSAITAAAYTTRWSWKASNGSVYLNSVTNTSDSIAYFSSIGPPADGYQKPDIAAPGFQVISVFPNSFLSTTTYASSVTPDLKHWVMAGTSMAAPCVAGSIALLFQANPTLSASTIKSLLTSNAMTDAFTGTSLPNYRWGYGKLDVAKAMTALVTPSATNTRNIIYYDNWSRTANDVTDYNNYVQVKGGASEKYAVRITLSTDSKLTGILFHTYSTVTLNNNLTAELWSNNSSNLPSERIAGPFTINPNAVVSSGWNYVDIPKDSTFTLTANANYHLVLYPASGTSDTISFTRDVNAISGRSSYYSSGSWSAYSSGDIRIRAVAVETNGVTPVELNSFTATSSSNAVDLVWTTATETNNYGFSIERKKIGTDVSWKMIGFVPGNGTNAITHHYSYTDNSISMDGSYLYRLGQIDNGGAMKYSSELEVAINLPKQFVVWQNYPNPFNPSTTIAYDLPVSNHTKIVVFDCLGKEITTLVDEYQDAGSYKVTFDAAKLASGIYFYKISSGSNIMIRKMILLK